MHHKLCNWGLEWLALLFLQSYSNYIMFDNGLSDKWYWQQIFVESLQTLLVWLPLCIKTISHMLDQFNSSNCCGKKTHGFKSLNVTYLQLSFIKTSDSFFINYDLSIIKGLPDNMSLKLYFLKMLHMVLERY